MSKLTDFFKAMLDEGEPEKVSLAAGRVTKIECARSGEFTAMGGKKVKFTPESLKSIAENFAEPKKLKIGHGPILTDTPNAGQVTGLSYDEKRDRLVATVKPTDHLAAQNRSGAFERVSMELVPKGETYTLDALSFLGAHEPAITDLEPVALAAGDERVILCCAEEEGAETLDFAEFTAEMRKKMAAEGMAMPDGSYPIRNRQDCANAIQAFGRAKNPDAVKRHIIKRAKELNATDLLPADWPGSTKKVAAASADEEGQVEKEKLELAEAENKRLKERLAKSVANDVGIFMASEAVTKRVPMKALKGGGLERFLTALATLDAEGGGATIRFATPDGKGEVDTTLYEAAKQIFLSFPEKTKPEDEEETVTAARAAEETNDVQEVKLAGVDPDSAKLDFAARKEIQAAKAKGLEISYHEAVRRVEMARAK